MTDDHIHHCLRELGKILKTDLEWDETGQCCLEFEDSIELILSHHEGCMAVRSMLCDGAEGNLRHALSLQYRNPEPGFFLGLDDRSDSLYLITLLVPEEFGHIPDVMTRMLHLTRELRPSRDDTHHSPAQFAGESIPFHGNGVVKA